MTVLNKPKYYCQHISVQCLSSLSDLTPSEYKPEHRPSATSIQENGNICVLYKCLINQSINKTATISPFTFDCADKNDEKIGVRVELSCVDDTVVDLVRALNLFQHTQ
jgi:hypothetical protein